MARYRLTSIRVVLVAMLLLAGVTGVLGTVVAMGSAPATAPELPLPRPEPCSPGHPCLAIVIDDVGRDLGRLRRLLRLDLDLTYSVLPHAAHTRESLAAIRRRGREVLLHLPMAPVDPDKITDERIVLGREGPLEPALLACLAKVPDPAGVNNHMGSALSRDGRMVARVLEVLKRRSLPFLDSRTASQSRFCQQARRVGLPCIERDVFLDDPPLPSAVRSRLVAAMDIARQRGWAVAIGHPLRSTVDALQKLRVGSRVRVVRLSAVLASEM